MDSAFPEVREHTEDEEYNEAAFDIQIEGWIPEPSPEHTYSPQTDPRYTTVARVSNDGNAVVLHKDKLPPPMKYTMAPISLYHHLRPQKPIVKNHYSTIKCYSSQKRAPSVCLPSRPTKPSNKSRPTTNNSGTSRTGFRRIKSAVT
jgi:hypothetical protein